MISFTNLPLELEGVNFKLKQWLKEIIRQEGFEPGDIKYFFYNDEQLLEVNLKFLNHDTYTDIITFDYGEANLVQGEIYISEERIRENAVTMGQALFDEMLRVVVHGVLHLCGYKDKTAEDASVMRQKESWSIQCYKKLNSK
ncbi:MAG: rRNA maturation RNase YbeY [Bacteroidales bacterium]|nr:rRNA maturation RNase YbeY [Bacteroidales bacterium]